MTGGKESAEKQFQEMVRSHRAKGSNPGYGLRGGLEKGQGDPLQPQAASDTPSTGRPSTFLSGASSTLSFIVGIVGGTYGIGGGSIIAPFFVTVFGLPVYTVAGAALMGTFVTSVAGVAFYQAIAPFYPHLSVAPDWLLGILVRRGRHGGNVSGGPLPEVSSRPGSSSGCWPESSSPPRFKYAAAFFGA